MSGWDDFPLATAEAAPAAPATDPWAGYAVVGSPASTVAQRVAHGPMEAIQAGYQSSATGLILRNRLPDVVLDPQHSKWYEKALASAGQMVSELPEMIAGGYAGGAAGAGIGGAAGTAIPGVGNVVGATIGGIAGGGAGSFAVPTAIREAYMQALTKGQITSAGDFLDRASIVLKQTAKSGLVGALTGAAGAVAARTAGAAIAPAIGATLTPAQAISRIGTAELGAQYATMVVAPAALEGKLPEPEDFFNAAVLLGGFKAAGSVAGKLRDIYAQTGAPPEEVVRRSTVDPTVQEDLAKPGQELPRAYQPIAAQDAAQNAVPGTKSQQVVESPFADVPKDRSPIDVNYNYINTTDDAQGALARLSQVYGEEMQKQRRGTVSWEQTNAEVADRLAGMADDPKAAMEFLARAPGTAAGAAELRAREQLVVGAAEDMAIKARAYMDNGGDANATPEQKAALVASVERAAMLSSTYLGARAEAGRALNILRQTASTADRAEVIQDVLAHYGDKPEVIAKMLANIDDPASALKASRMITAPTFAQKIGEVYKAILLSGPKTYMVKAIGDSVNIAMTTAERWVAATVSKIPGIGSGEIGYDEALGYTSGMMSGTKDALRVWAAAWNGEGPFEHTSAIGGKTGEVLSIPHRIMSSETEFFRTLDESGQLRALAIRRAIGENLTPGTDDFNSRVADIESQVRPLVDGVAPQSANGAPSFVKDMAAAVKLAGDRGTFTEKMGPLGQLFQAVSRNPVGQFVIPFARVPGNLLKFATRYLPGVNLLIGDVRNDLAAGGAGRDLALAKMVIGSAIATTAYAAVKNGTLTGSGDTFTPEEKSGKLASGEWQPYSIKVGDTWYSYNRFEPMARVLGIGADIAELTDRVEGDDKASLPALVALMFGHAVISETYLSTLDGMMKGLEEPQRYGKLVFDNFVGSWVPGFLAQTATAIDPNKRVVDNVFDAVRSRLPFIREQLLPKINPLTGQPEPNPKNLTPVDHVSEATDKVLSEAGRIGVMVRGAPPNIQLPGSSLDKKAGSVQTTPEQRNKFDIAAGTLAHEVLTPIVNEAGWDKLPDIVQKKVYQRVLASAHKLGAAAAFTPEERAAYISQMQDKIGAELAATGDDQ